MTEIQIAAVGDLLVKPSLIADAKQPDGGYSFETLFAKAAPYLKQADLTIGNLEVPLAGDRPIRRRKQKPYAQLLTCPDELAPALKEAGFDVLITANNHCLDQGETGLVRTLQALDQHGIHHTGTFKSFKESKELLIKTVKDIHVGILSYTTGTNRNPLPAGKPWMVNRIREQKVIRDLRALRKKADLVILCLHFGQEYHDKPDARQKRLTNLFFKHGANIILGAHPHVLQPMSLRSRKRFVIYSLGNFVSPRLKGNPYTQSGAILNITVTKDTDGRTRIKDASYIPTCVARGESGKFEIIPIRDALEKNDTGLTPERRKQMNRLLSHTVKILG